MVLGMTFLFFRSHLLFPYSIWTFNSLFSLDFLFGLLFPFFIWNFISLFYLDFIRSFFDLSIFFWSFDLFLIFRYFFDISIFFRSFQSRSDFGFLPNFFSLSAHLLSIFYFDFNFSLKINASKWSDFFLGLGRYVW